MFNLQQIVADGRERVDLGPDYVADRGPLPVYYDTRISDHLHSYGFPAVDKDSPVGPAGHFKAVGIPMAQIDWDKSLEGQPRGYTSEGLPFLEENVDGMIQSYKEGRFCPAIVVERLEDGRYRICEGINRGIAAAIIGNTHINAYVIYGPPEKIRMFRLRANSTNGRGQTAGEKLNAAKFDFRFARAASNLNVTNLELIKIVAKRNQVKWKDLETEIRAEEYDTSALRGTAPPVDVLVPELSLDQQKQLKAELAKSKVEITPERVLEAAAKYQKSSNPTPRGPGRPKLTGLAAFNSLCARMKTTLVQAKESGELAKCASEVRQELGKLIDVVESANYGS